MTGWAICATMLAANPAGARPSATMVADVQHAVSGAGCYFYRTGTLTNDFDGDGRLACWVFANDVGRDRPEAARMRLAGAEIHLEPVGQTGAQPLLWLLASKAKPEQTVTVTYRAGTTEVTVNAVVGAHDDEVTTFESVELVISHQNKRERLVVAGDCGA